MLLSDVEIVERMKQGSIVIEPFNEAQLNNVSYDLTLGNNFAFHNDVLLFKDVRDHNTNWFLEPKGDFEVLNVDKGVLLRPQQRCLAHSREYVGGTISNWRPSISVTSYLQATSTAARLGLSACLCAGWGDVGYINRWTFEIYNFSPKPILLPVGGVLAQICFEEVTTPHRIYGKHQGSYQVGTNLEQIKANWSPDMMIPKKMKVYP